MTARRDVSTPFEVARLAGCHRARTTEALVDAVRGELLQCPGMYP